MINWTKPNGMAITTNEMDVTIAYAEKLGWKRVKQTRKSKGNEDGDSGTSNKGFFAKNISAGFGS